MRMIEMCVDAENLTKASAAVVEECFREACVFANPIATVSVHHTRHVSTCGCSRNLGWKCFRVMDLAIHPPLNEGNVLRCRYRNGVFLVV